MHKSTWQRASIAAVATLALAATAACSSGSTGNSEGGGGSDTLHVRMGGSPISSDPFQQISTFPWLVLGNVYEGLVSLDDEYNPIPMLASSWEVNDGGTEYTFQLRTDAVFQNGDKMTADDVKYSLDYYRENAFRSSDLASVESVEVVDGETVKVTLANSWGNFLVALGYRVGPVIVPEGSADDNGLVTTPIGSGPYKIDSYSDAKVELTKFEDYVPIDEPASEFGGKKEAQVEHIVFDVVEEPQTAMAGMQTGDFDIVTDLDGLNAEQADAIPGWSVDQVTGTVLANAYINAGDDGLPDAQIRRAMFAAIDTQTILDQVYSGAGTLTHSFISPVVSWYDKEAAEYWPYDGGVEQAKELLADSDYDGEAIEVISGIPEQHDAAVVMGQNLEEAGFTVNLTKLDYPAYQDRLNKGDFQIAATGTAARVPVDSLFAEWYCDGGELDKRFGFCDPKYDEMYENAISTMEADDRNAQFAEMERYLKDQAVYFPWQFQPTIAAVSDQVQGFRNAPSGFLPFWDVSLDG